MLLHMTPLSTQFHISFIARCINLLRSKALHTIKARSDCHLHTADELRHSTRLDLVSDTRYTTSFIITLITARIVNRTLT